MIGNLFSFPKLNLTQQGLTHYGLQSCDAHICQRTGSSLIQVPAVRRQAITSTNAGFIVNTLRPRQNDCHFADIFKCISLNEKF